MSRTSSAYVAKCSRSSVFCDLSGSSACPMHSHAPHPSPAKSTSRMIHTSSSTMQPAYAPGRAAFNEWRRPEAVIDSPARRRLARDDEVAVLLAHVAALGEIGEDAAD